MKKPIFLESSNQNALNMMRSCITHLLCCFNYPVTEVVADYEPPYITDIILSTDSLSFTLVGCNQLSEGTVERYQKEVNVTGSVWEDASGVVKVRSVFPDGNYSYGNAKVYISPCVVMFLNNNVSAYDTDIQISVASPLTVSVDAADNKLKVSADAEVLPTAFATPEQPTEGILSINGVVPVSGNIQIGGVGNTTVTVTEVEESSEESL